MPEPIAETYVQIDYKSVKDAQNAVDQFGQRFKKASGEVDTQSEKMRKGFAAVASAVATIGIAKFGADVISAATKMDSLRMSMTRIEGSTALANKRLGGFREIAKDPGV